MVPSRFLENDSKQWLRVGPLRLIVDAVIHIFFPTCRRTSVVEKPRNGNGPSRDLRSTRFALRDGSVSGRGDEE